MSFALFITYVLCTYLRPFDTIAPEMAVYRPMLILWGLAFGAALARAFTRHEVAARPAHFGLLGLLVAAIGLSQLANHMGGYALVGIPDFSTAAMLMVLCLLNLTTLRRLQVTCVVVACSVIVLAGVGIYSFHTGFMAEQLVLRQNTEASDEADLPPESADYASPSEDKSGRYLLRLKSFGFLNDPNDFAQTLVMVLPLLWWLYVRGRTIRNLLVVAVPGAMAGYAIYLTQSRGALLGVAALGILVMERVLGLFRTVVVMAFVVAGAGVVSFGGRDMSTKEQSAAQRIEAWQEGVSMLRGQPVLGVGYGNFTDHHYLTAHNSFVLCFAELGLVGYFAWLGLIVLTYKGLSQAIRLPAPESPERKMAVVLKASLIAYLACSWFLSRTYSPGLFMLLALCVAAWFVATRTVAGSVPAGAGEPPPKWFTPTLVSMVVSIAAVYGIVVFQRSVL